MPNVFTGRAAIYGIVGTMTVEGAATGHFNIQGAPVTGDWETVELRGQSNEMLGAGAINPFTDIEIEFIPVKLADGTDVPDEAKTLPPPFARVTLAAFVIGGVNGDYYYKGGGKITPEPGGWTKLTLPLRRYADVDLSIAPGL